MFHCRGFSASCTHGYSTDLSNLNQVFVIVFSLPSIFVKNYFRWWRFFKTIELEISYFSGSFIAFCLNISQLTSSCKWAERGFVLYIKLITIIEEDICTFIVVLFAGIPLRACRYAGLSGLIIVLKLCQLCTRRPPPPLSEPLPLSDCVKYATLLPGMGGWR